MRKKEKGSLTIFLALTALLFLTFCLVLIEGTRNYYIRTKAEQAMELTEFSVLSEYQAELFRHYGVFFLDLDYEQGKEYQSILEARARRYLTNNANETDTTEIVTGKFCRATDSQGGPFFTQAVELMKYKSGYKVFENILGAVGDRTEEAEDLEEIIDEQEDEADDNLEIPVDEEGEPLFHVSIPSVSFPSIGALRSAVFGSDAGLSRKSIVLSERLLQRNLSRGYGSSADRGFVNMQLFHSYILKHCNYYGSEDPDQWTDRLEYQIEYIVAGKDNDLENLENVMWRIFLLRASGNYLFFHQDPSRMQSARAQALAIAGITGNGALIAAVQELLLLAQAIEEGITDTRKIFAGEQVPLYENGTFSGIKFGYQEYLMLFLNTMGSKEKVYRCMDIVELETREQCGYERLRLDHCVDSFELEWTYGFPSLFLSIPLMDGQNYETTITRRLYYKT